VSQKSIYTAVVEANRQAQREVVTTLGLAVSADNEVTTALSPQIPDAVHAVHAVPTNEGALHRVTIGTVDDPRIAALETALRNVLAILDPKQHMRPEQQLTLAEARDMLAQKR
jgi:hypothetical protein